MGKDINAWKKVRLICVKNDVKRKKSQEPRKTVGIGNVSVCHRGMDFLGPLPGSRNGTKQILVVTDLFTKWVELFPAMSQTAKEAVQCIM